MRADEFAALFAPGVRPKGKGRWTARCRAHGDTVTLVSHGWDKYGGRIDGTITLADGRNLTAVMVAAGQAAPWDGQGPKPVPTPSP